LYGCETYLVTPGTIYFIDIILFLVLEFKESWYEWFYYFVPSFNTRPRI